MNAMIVVALSRKGVKWPPDKTTELRVLTNANIPNRSRTKTHEVVEQNDYGRYGEKNRSYMSQLWTGPLALLSLFERAKYAGECE
jgi:hypothetical protein